VLNRYRCDLEDHGVGMRFKRAIAAMRAVTLAMLAWWALAGAAMGTDTRDRTIEQFYHTAWTVREGAPGQVTALAQSADGYLWLGTQTGLYRFDGVRFERYRPRSGGDFPASSVASLYAPPDGGLWVGFRYGFASFIDGDKATHYGASSGLPTATVYAMAGTPGWAALGRDVQWPRRTAWPPMAARGAGDGLAWRPRPQPYGRPPGPPMGRLRRGPGLVATGG
jgi:Two component regulator propeller.